jgi:hypothetical protein
LPSIEGNAHGGFIVEAFSVRAKHANIRAYKHSYNETMILGLLPLVSPNPRGHFQTKRIRSISNRHRRLVIIDYNGRPPEKRIEGFDKVLIEEEGSGILNFAIEGLVK